MVDRIREPELPLTNHAIKRRNRAGEGDDLFYTPSALAALCVEMVPIQQGDTCLDPAYGTGAFHQWLPDGSGWCEVAKGKDFYDHHDPVDWLITNPPYSHLDAWLDHSARLALKGVAYLLGWNNLTARRIERLEAQHMGITAIKMFKVFGWFGMSAFVVWERDKDGLIQYDRTVWRG